MGQLPARAQKAVLHGPDEQVHVRYRNRYGRERSYYASYEGVVPWLERRHAETDSDYAREQYEGYMREVPCPACHGTRLKPEILAVTIDGRSIADVCRAVDRRGRPLPAGAAAHRAGADHRRAGAEGGPRAAGLPGRRRPDYLSLDRAAATLAGGEAQRIRLATQIGSGLVGCALRP